MLSTFRVQTKAPPAPSPLLACSRLHRWWEAVGWTSSPLMMDSALAHHPAACRFGYSLHHRSFPVVLFLGLVPAHSSGFPPIPVIMIHTNLKKKFSYFILAFLLLAVICVWKKGSYEALKLQAKEFQVPKSLEKLAMGSGLQSRSASSQQDPKQDSQILSHLRVTAKVKPQSSYQVWDKDSSSKNLNPRLQKILKNYLNMNKYKVSYKGPGPGVKLSAETLRCHLRDHVNVSMVEATDFPFNTTEWKGYLPKENFRTKAGPWHRCAVVSSAGALKSSQLGREIGMSRALAGQGPVWGNFKTLEQEPMHTYLRGPGELSQGSVFSLE